MKTESIPLKGITRAAPDNVSGNGELAVAMNAVNDGAGLEPIEQSEAIFPLATGEQLLAVHVGDGYKHYILLNGTTLKYYSEDFEHDTDRTTIATITTGITSLETIGNTLVYCDGDGMKYVLWDTDTSAYNNLGAMPPPPKFRFGLKGEFACYPPAGTESGKLEMLEAPFEAMTEEEQKQFTKNPYSPESPAPGNHYNDDGGEDTHIESIGGYHHDVHHPSRDNHLWRYDEEEQEIMPYTTYNLDLEKSYKTGIHTKLNESVDKMTEYAMGHVMGLVDEAHKEGKFVMPFFVRVCYEMYDGSHIMHSYPVLMVPNSDAPMFLLDQKHNDNHTSANGGFNVGCDYNAPYDTAYWTVHGRAYAWAARLVCRCVMSATERTTLAKWKDIIPRVVIGVSKPFYTYLQDGKVYGWKQLVTTAASPQAVSDEINDAWGCLRRNEVADAGYSNYLERNLIAALQVQDINDNTKFAEGAKGYEGYCILDNGDYVLDHGAFYALRIPRKPRTELYDEIKGNGTFYRLDFIRTADLGTDTSNPYEKIYTEKDRLNTITAARQLDAYDGSLDAVRAKAMFGYNQRLLIGNTETKSHGLVQEGTQHAMEAVTYLNAEISGTTKSIRQRVTVGGKTYVAKDTGEMFANHLPRWIWYPDSKATQMEVLIGGTTLYTVPMEIHAPLLGAYHFAGLDTISESGTTPSPAPSWTYADNAPTWEASGSEYKYSRVANPFVFPAGWGGNAGSSTIKAFAAATKAVSEGQFGQYPVYVFCADGVWMLGVNSGGDFTAANAVQRDILLDGTSPVSIDDSVLFITARGIVSLRGGSAKVLSLPLDGERWLHPDISRELAAFLGSDAGAAMWAKVANTMGYKPSDAAVIMYDYAHNRVYFTSNGVSWVYNMKTGLWTQSEMAVTSAVNTWSGAFVTDGKVCRMGDTKAARMAIVTRSMKFRGGQLQRLRGMVSDGILPSRMMMSAYGSRDWRSQSLMSSVWGNKMRNLAGSPYKGHSAVILTEGDCALTTLLVSHDGDAVDEIR